MYFLKIFLLKCSTGSVVWSSWFRLYWCCNERNHPRSGDIVERKVLTNQFNLIFANLLVLVLPWTGLKVQSMLCRSCCCSLIMQLPRSLSVSQPQAAAARIKQWCDRSESKSTGESEDHRRVLSLSLIAFSSSIKTTHCATTTGLRTLKFIIVSCNTETNTFAATNSVEINVF